MARVMRVRVSPTAPRTGVSPSPVKAADSESAIRRFESYYPCQISKKVAARQLFFAEIFCERISDPVLRRSCRSARLGPSQIQKDNQREKQGASHGDNHLIADPGCHRASKDGAHDTAQLLRSVRVAKDLASICRIRALRENGVDCRKDACESETLTFEV